MGILFDKLTEYGKSDYYPYHMPGHKRQSMGALPMEWSATDITEIDGFDNLHDAQGILQEIQQKAAKAYGAEESFYLVNGSTCGILSAISAVVPFGGELLMVRNCHKAVYHAAYLRQLRLHYIYPHVKTDFDLCEAVTVKQVEQALEEYPGVSAVLVVSPTYEGRIADIEAIARVVHEKGVPLIVDEAHGAHLGFAPQFATNSARLGADVVINSVHKTLPAMTQTALLHVNGQLVSREELKRFLRIYQTSSPSYVMMSSIEEAVDKATEGKDFETFAVKWQRLLQDLQGCKCLRILPQMQECIQKQHDIGKLILSVSGTELSGQQFYDMLLKDYHLQAEMVCDSYVLCMFTMADGPEAYERLKAALLEIDARLTVTRERKGSCLQEESSVLRLEAKLPLHEAWELEQERISLEEAEGRQAGEFVNLYPPGTPIAVPGECLTAEVISVIKSYLAGGLAVQGIAADGSVAVLKQ
ncbi:MAG: aminotransferase class V-fold PLP-dependent enzyme [Lachnospiraceae bacterium]|nr:aminotransferase class V-fold PLP-dependent enzyme [Lachnospiraceae bacterium]